MRESEWLRMPHPSVKIIDDTTFASVPQHLATFTINKSDEPLVDELRSIPAIHGRPIPTAICLLRALLLQPLSPPSWNRVGSLMRAYQLIGYDVRPESRIRCAPKKGVSCGCDARSAVKWGER